MNNFYQSGQAPGPEDKRPSQNAANASPNVSLGTRIMNWWHSIASPPAPPENATVLQREKHRRARSVSVIVLFFFPIVVAGLPTTLSLPNPWIFWVACSILVALILAPFFNRAGHVFVAGMLIILSFQFTMTFYILTTMPLNEGALQIYDMFTLAILLALVILPLRIIWILTIYDCVFIILDLLYQPRTEAFTKFLEHDGLSAILARPLAIILFLTCVCTFLLTSVTKAVQQSYQSEFVANLEHAAAQQNEREAVAKRELEESIQQIVQAHTDIMNGKMNERIPYPTAKMLWPLVGVLNTLWTRLQRAHQREQTLVQVQEDIIVYNEIVQRAVRSPQQPLEPYTTKTPLSPLTFSVANLQRELLNLLHLPPRRSR